MILLSHPVDILGDRGTQSYRGCAHDCVLTKRRESGESSVVRVADS